ncbi:MAG: flagellar biosynthetic protein FliQ [Polyangiales bacterium]
MTRAVELAREALLLAAWLSGPALLAGFAATALVGFAASRAQLHDPALSLVPRALAVTAALALAGGWMGVTLLRFTRALWGAMPTLAP